nr:hypothetical protein [Tanacetum cinerariifolium]
SDPDSPAPKPTKTARKPKPTVPKAHPRPSVSKPVSSTQPEPTSAPAKPQGKKRKLTIEISDKPSTAVKSKHGFVSKKRKPIITLRALEESMKCMYDVPRGPHPPVVIREPKSRKYQPLPEVSRNGKAKARPDPGDQDEGQAGSNPDEQAEGEGQAGSNPDEQAEDREHMDLDVADVSPQPPPEQIDEGFTATAYPKETDSYKSHEDHMQLYKALEKTMNCDHSEELAKDLAEARKKNKKSHESPKTPHGSPPHQPPPPPPPAGASGALGSLGASRSSQMSPPQPPPPSTN